MTGALEMPKTTGIPVFDLLLLEMDMKSLLLAALATLSAGAALASRHDQVAAWLDPVTEILLGLLLAAYLWRVFRRSRRRDAA